MSASHKTIALNLKVGDRVVKLGRVKAIHDTPAPNLEPGGGFNVIFENGELAHYSDHILVEIEGEAPVRPKTKMDEINEMVEAHHLWNRLEALTRAHVNYHNQWPGSKIDSYSRLNLFSLFSGDELKELKEISDEIKKDLELK